MKNVKLMIISTVAVLSLSGADAQAKRTGLIPMFDAYQYEYYPHLTADQKSELKLYLDYEEREPCQNYRIVPQGFYRNNCDLAYRYPAGHVDTTTRTVMNTYKITFDFDSSRLGSSANSILDQIASEIKQYNPSEVVVSGYTDRAGSMEYNTALSHRRASNVSNSLRNRGIANRVIDQRSYGENNLAVETDDGVRMLENRRVIIQFLK